VSDAYPQVAEDALSGTALQEIGRTEDTVFRTPTAAVTGHTLVYDDAALSDALAAAGAEEVLAGVAEAGGDWLVDVDDAPATSLWRFAFATRLSFSPPLAPGVGPASMLPTVRTEARRSFADELGDRGAVDVERGRSQRMRTEAGDRARLVKYTGQIPLQADHAFDVEAWLAVWAPDTTFRIAGGAYPTRGLDALLDSLPDDERPETNPRVFRDDLLAFIRGVA
jgi:hypothetical protein